MANRFGLEAWSERGALQYSSNFPAYRFYQKRWLRLLPYDYTPEDDVITAVSALPWGDEQNWGYVYDFKLIRNDWDYRQERYGAAAWDENGNLTWTTSGIKPLKIVEYVYMDFWSPAYRVPPDRKYAFIYLGQGQEMEGEGIDWGSEAIANVNFLVEQSPNTMEVFRFSIPIREDVPRGAEISPDGKDVALSFLVVDVTGY